MPTIAPIRRAKPSEEGYILVIVMFMLALLILSMAVAIPKVAQDIQRDRDLETYHRGMQYRRAIQLYYKRFNRYPPNIDALVKTNEIRFLRKKYIDPTTGKDDWKPVMFGQNKTPVAMGFFGQPLGGIGAGGNLLAGTGPGGSSGIPGANPIVGSTNTGTDANGNPTDPSLGGTTPTSGTTAPGASSPAPGTNPSFGGAGIIGVSPASPKQSIYVYKKKNHYNEWEFLYSPLSELGGLGTNPVNLQPSAPCSGAPGTGTGCTSTPTPSPTPTPTPTPSPAPDQPQ